MGSWADHQPMSAPGRRDGIVASPPTFLSLQKSFVGLFSSFQLGTADEAPPKATVDSVFVVKYPTPNQKNSNINSNDG